MGGNSEAEKLLGTKPFADPSAFYHALHENKSCHVLHCICFCSGMPGITCKKPFSFNSSWTWEQWGVLSASGYWTQRSLRGKCTYIFLQHELDVSVHSFNSSTPLILVAQDHILTPISLRRCERTARNVLIFPAEKNIQVQKGINKAD